MHARISVVWASVGGVVAFGFSAPAFAYLDPGTGSALLQGILAALAAIGVTVKLYWHRLLRLLGLKRNKTGEKNGEGTERDSASASAEDGQERSDH